MIDPLPQVIATLIDQMDAELDGAKRGSRFADEAHWTASNEAVEAMLIEHLRTTGDPVSERPWLLLSILMDYDESRTEANSDDIFFRDTPITDDEIIAAWRLLVGNSDDPAFERRCVYITVVTNRALNRDDGQTPDFDLTLQVGQQLNTAVELLTEQRVSAKRN